MHYTQLLQNISSSYEAQHNQNPFISYENRNLNILMFPKCIKPNKSITSKRFLLIRTTGFLLQTVVNSVPSTDSV